MSRILLVEDSPEHQLLITQILNDRFQVKCAKTATEARTAIERDTFDLVLLDASLPDGDGFGLCTELRSAERTKNVPILFVTGRTDIRDKLFGFSLGADDYIVKPFEPLELRARVEARIARYMHLKETGFLLQKGDLRLYGDCQRAMVSHNGQETDLHLTPAEFKILHYLCTNEGKVLTREQILKKVWGADISVVERVVDKHVSCLRKKIVPYDRYISTVSGVGYRFLVTDMPA